MRSRFAAALIICNAQTSEGTSVMDNLNYMISRGSNGVYTGGKGVIVRADDFESSGGSKVVASSFWSNDIYAPSQFYPTAGNSWFPNNGWDGHGSTSWMEANGDAGAAGPWTWAALGVVIGTKMDGLYPEFDNIQNDDWGWGVFYATDSNACDKRCVWQDDKQGYDCPGGWVSGNDGVFSPGWNKGAGDYEMSVGSGGAGCHFDSNSNAIDQEDSDDPSANLVGSANCECNYDLKGNDWDDWVWKFIYSGKQKSGFEDRTWLSGGGGKAPNWALDAAVCWVNNPRDLIKMQNSLFWNRLEWNNGLIPQVDLWSWDVAEQRKYWGWNEVPVNTRFVEDSQNWDTIMIKLPAAPCNNGQSDWGRWDGPGCLGQSELYTLENDLEQYVLNGKLLLGYDKADWKPGSHILFVREYGEAWSQLTATAGGPPEINWQREFFCENWKSPNGKYKVVDAGDKCYLDNGWQLAAEV